MATDEKKPDWVTPAIIVFGLSFVMPIVLGVLWLFYIAMTNQVD